MAFRISPSTVKTSSTLLACLAGSLSAQDITPMVNDRVDYGIVDGVESEPLAPLVEDESTKRAGLLFQAIVSSAYDTNIFLNATDEIADQVSKLGVKLGYQKGDRLESEGAFVDATYQPNAVFFAERSDDNRIDHEALWIAGWRGKVTTLAYRGEFRKLGDATADTGEQADRVVQLHEARAGWLAREKITFELAGGISETAYESEAFFDSKKVYGECVILYAYSPKTRVGLGYQLSRFDVDGASTQNVQQLTARMAWQPREKIQLSLQGGVERRQTENGKQTNPVFEGRVDWTPQEGTKLYLTAYQNQQASAFFLGQNYKVAGITAGVSQRIGRNWAVRLEGGREATSYSRVSGEGPSGREDRIWFVRPSIDYTLTESMSLGLFYRMSKNSSNDELFGYEQALAGLEFTYQF